MFKKNPLSLIIVAFIFLLIGLAGLFKQIGTFYNEGFVIAFNIGMLGIPVFWGLLKHRKGWRTLALFFIWIEMVSPLIVLGNIIFGWDIQLLGISFPLVLVPYVAISLVGLWQYKVLTSKEIKAMFFPEKEESV